MHSKKYVEDNPFGLSVGDLMAALLFVFILVLSSTLLRLEKVIEEKKTQVEKIDEREKAKRSIIQRLKGEMEEFDVEVDPQTGVIRIKEGILFPFGSSALKSEGKIFLQKFTPKYAEILLSDSEIVEQLAQVIVEGHTDNIGSYTTNMRLSLERANSVAEYIFNSSLYFDYIEELKKYLSANGRSYMEPRSTNLTDEGRMNNRRVEFKFRLKDWDLDENAILEK